MQNGSWTNIKLSYDTTDEYDDECGEYIEDVEIHLFGSRLETDKEFEDRLVQEAENERLRKEYLLKEKERLKQVELKKVEERNELQEYKRLKAKYG